MRTSWCRAAILAAACGLPGCDMDLDLFDEPITIPTRPCLEASEWRIRGFSDGDAMTDAVRLPLGHSRELFVYPFGGLSVDCDEAVVSVRWDSTRPDVAEFFAEGPAPRFAWLTGRTLGDTYISAEVALSDGRRITAPLNVDGDVLPIRVMSAADPSVGQNVLLEGTVDLEPENQAATPSTRAYLVFDVPSPGLLSMFVDWQSVSNGVTPHLCPGEASFPTGCSPLIDGTRFRGHKPVSASTQASPGTHTLWITNGGPEAETVRYLVGLIPS